MNDVTEAASAAQQSSEGRAWYPLGFQISNYQRVEYLQVDLDEPGLTIIGGPNGSGKTSTLRGLKLLVGDEKLPAYPIRMGAHEAVLELRLSDGVQRCNIQLEIDSSGPTFRLTGADGQPFNGGRAPKTFIKNLLQKFAFDPLEFARQKKEEQDQVLKDLDPETTKKVLAVDAEYAKVFAERTGINTEFDSLKKRFEASPVFQGVPDEEESIADLSAELETRLAAEQKQKDLESAARVAVEDLEKQELLQSKLEDQLAALEKQLADLQISIESKKADIRTGAGQVEARRTHVAATSKELSEYAFAPPEEVRLKLKTIDEVNTKVRANAARRALAAQRDQAKAAADAKTARLNELKEKRAELLASANFPIPGLGFNELGPTYKNIPLSAAAHSEIITISTAIGMSRNPQLRLMVLYDIDKLGTAAIAQIAQMAKERGYYVIGEKFTETGEGCDIVLENGRRKAEAAE